MSRVGRNPITVPEGVTVEINGSNVSVKGPKGKLENAFNENISIKQEAGQVIVERPNDTPQMRSLHGTTRALIANMITGVNQGFTKTLELIGVGYRVAAKGKGLTLALGYSHPIEILPIEGITFKLEGNTKINVEGIDRALVGQVAADIRAKRAPEPYKGKGVKYSDEVIRRKEGKKA
ncbi:50S ribosomal protein L6 [Haliovirga abyssi]|uniref:Large ribosomal subunit protein uL6 n=1 Tax=Haliovirga abyssi TaxID=2996794 RepID=A0AAU9DBP6_9FUSO|nr:50S ribosomal protein L6 [Haliovirga abyssi]BDU49538.1 50S ribosomal protein L6 [Haliovirga abyssi]